MRGKWTSNNDPANFKSDDPELERAQRYVSEDSGPYAVMHNLCFLAYTIRRVDEKESNSANR